MGSAMDTAHGRAADAELDIPKDTIALALGHGGSTVTDIYINYDLRKVDVANRQIIDLIVKK